MGEVTALTNLDVISSGVRLCHKSILLRGGKIIAIVDASEPLSQCTTIYDYTGYVALPGLIDLQIYGSGGHLFGGNPTLAAVNQMEGDLVAQGVTGFLASIATNTDEVMYRGIQVALTKREKAIGNCWGLHLEGPYLSPAKRGAHPEDLIRSPTAAEVDNLLKAASGSIKMMTVAPERVDSSILAYLNSAGIVLSAGHSNASYEEGKQFLHNPIRAVTHLFNAMPSLHHRDVGFTLAVLENKPFASIIADGIHVAYPMIKLAKEHLKEKLFLITDAVTSSSEGIYQHILNNNDRYVMPDGTLSGSALTLMKAMQNCVQHCDISMEEAVNMTTLYPAQVINMSHCKGQIGVGFDADMCIMTDNFQPIATFIAGVRVFRNSAVHT